jgi:hypothetical protein
LPVYFFLAGEAAFLRGDRRPVLARFGIARRLALGFVDFASVPPPEPVSA